MGSHFQRLTTGVLAALSLLHSGQGLAHAASSALTAGSIGGTVTDSRGIRQMGATVLLVNRLERVIDRTLTDANGMFAFPNLPSGSYSIKVQLPTFLPALRTNILVLPGARNLLSVNLSGLLSSIQWAAPGTDLPQLMTDDWKWVLRTSSATRPVLRFAPSIVEAGRAEERRRSVSAFSETRGLLRVSAGDGGSQSAAGSESDLGTAFALATSLYGANQVQVSGNVGFASLSGAPTAGFRTSFSRDFGGFSTPEVSVMMRQLFVPGRVGFGIMSQSGLESNMPALRTMAVSLQDRKDIGDSLRLDYGFTLESVSFLDRLNYLSPYARLTYNLGENSDIELTYSSGLPRGELSRGPEGTADAELQSELASLSMFPRVSLRGGRARVQRGENMEITYGRRFGSRSIRAGAYRERIANAAVAISAPDGVYSGGDILPDLFTNTSVFNAGRYSSIGYTAVFTQQLGESFNASLTFGTGNALSPLRRTLISDDPEELRSLIRATRRNALTLRVSGRVPVSGTYLSAGYQWTDSPNALPAHIYATQHSRSEIGLNFYIRQPLPAIPFLPWRMEATADLRNMLAQGYLPLSLSDGRHLLLVQTPRSFRGGLSFIF